MRLQQRHFDLYSDPVTHTINIVWTAPPAHPIILAQYCCRRQLWYSVASFPAVEQPLLMPDMQTVTLRTVLFLLGINDTTEAIRQLNQQIQTLLTAKQTIEDKVS